MVQTLKDRLAAIADRQAQIQYTVEHLGAQIAAIEDKRRVLFSEFRDLQKEELMIHKKGNTNG